MFFLIFVIDKQGFTMVWSLRRRIKMLLGVHIYKSGTSTSLGAKGAKITIGPKDTYLHTCIPGTRIYN